MERPRENVGPRERLFRIAAGSAAVTAALLWPRGGAWRWLLGTWGVANIMTGLTRYCPSNHLLGIDNTRGEELVHFEPSPNGARAQVSRRLNEVQRRLGLTGGGAA
jgi:hypothetical protein